LAPHLIKDDNGNPMSWYTFRDRYCKTINTGYGVKVVGAKNYRELREKLKDFMIRRTRREVFGRDLLPPTNVYVTADTSTAKQVEALQNSEQGQLVMAALQSGNPLKALAKAEKQIAKLRKLFGLAKVPGVAKMISEELDAEPGSKIVLFGYHHDTIDALRNALKKYGAVSFDGRTPPARKVALNKKFMTDPNCRVIVGQLQAMGVGLDFSISDNTLFVEWSYVGDENGQAMSRIFNMNSPEPKFTRFAVLAGSLDAQIAAAATSKLKDSALILGGRTTL
jgi:SNF2 family DNA or RNA helicase